MKPRRSPAVAQQNGGPQLNGGSHMHMPMGIHDATMPVPISSFAMPASPSPGAAGAPASAGRARRCCAGWRNPQRWLMLAMFLLALFIFGVRFHQSQHLVPRRGPGIVPQPKRGTSEDVDGLDGFLGRAEVLSEAANRGAADTVEGEFAQESSKLGLPSDADEGISGEQAAEETDSGSFRPGGRLSRAKRRRRMARRKRPAAVAAGLARHRGPYGRASGNDRALGDADDLGSAGIVNAEKEELWIDQREEVGVGGELNTPLEEGTLSSGGRRQANVAAAGRGGRALPAGNNNERGARAAAVSGNGSGGATAVNVKAAGRFKRPVDGAAAAAAALGDNELKASARDGSLIRDPEEDDDLALPALKKPSTHPMPLLSTTQQHLGINEVVKHSDKPDDVASSDPELRVWDALDAGTHDDTLQDAILEHMQVEETVGFEEDEDPMLEVSDEEQELTEAELAAGAEVVPEEAAITMNEVRVVGGENMMEEHPVTEGLSLFDTGVKVIEEKPERAAAGKKEPERASVAEPQGAVAGVFEDAKEEDAEVSSKPSATSAVFGLDGSMAQWLKRLASGIGRSKTDDAEAAKKYQDAKDSLRGRAGFTGELTVGEGQS
ncbi:g9490 [Coccomyxa elongata]